MQALASIPSDSKTLYADRVAAARALRGHALNPTGSKELDLLARSGCVSSQEASRPYFIAARLVAAECTPNAAQREELLRGAVGDAPENRVVRVRYLQAASEASLLHRTLIASEPLMRNGIDGLMVSENGYGLTDHMLQLMPVSAQPLLNAAERNKLIWQLVHAQEKRGEEAEALQLLRALKKIETDAARRDALEKECSRLETETARQTENSARAPVLHRELEQDRIVRPRVLPGMAFTPRKSAENEEVAE
jgi:hypothetical protein